MRNMLRWVAQIGLGVGTVLAFASLVHANAFQAQFHLGRIWSAPENDGDAANEMLYPAGIPHSTNFGDGTTAALKRDWVGPHYKGGNYLWVTDWTAPDATLWPDAGSYFFRSMDYSYPETYNPNGNFNYLYPIDMQEYLRWEAPKLLIQVTGTTVPDSVIDFVFFPGEEGLATFKYPTSAGKGPRRTPIVDPDLITEEVIKCVWRYIPGVELTRNMFGYSYGSPHQDYYVEDMVLVNNGISGRKLDELPTPAADPPILTGQTINKMIWAISVDFRSTLAPGTQRGKDEDCMYVQPWGDPGYHAVLAFDTDDDETPGPDWGDPATDVAYESHLLGNNYAMIGPLFVSKGPGSNYAVDDLEQPAFRTVWYERGFDMQGSAPYTKVGDVQAQREFMTDGSIHLPTNTSFTQFAATAAIADNAAGPTAVIGYGRLGAERTLANINLQGWDLAFGDSIRITNMRACGGIDVEEARRIGRIWNEKKQASAPEAEWMSQADIDLVKSGRDTVMKAAALAYWNFNGEFPPNVTGTELAAWGISDFVTTKPAQYGPYDAPDGPRPPSFISVRPVNRIGIEVRWGTEPETDPDHDTKVPDFAGYRIYRQEASRMGPWVVMTSGPAENFVEVAEQGVFPAGRAYYDVSVTPGVDYWYCVTAYDDGTQNWEQPNRSLESTRWWTWSGFSNLGVTAPGQVGVDQAAKPDRFYLKQNIPNPFNPTTTIEFGVAEAGPTKLVIYNASGQVVRTLLDKTVPAGLHAATWDGTDQLGRSVASGLYIYRLTSGDRQLFRRMVLLK